ncbi:hypothetical protein [Desulfovibrio sp.]|nr:hypothetical protein [Desulfovibrio sp.]
MSNAAQQGGQRMHAKAAACDPARLDSTRLDAEDAGLQLQARA